MKSIPVDFDMFAIIEGAATTRETSARFRGRFSRVLESEILYLPLRHGYV